MSTPKSSFRRTPQKIFFCAFLCTVYLLTIAVASFAQSDNSSIAGVVTDPSGAVVANASITLTNEQNGAIRKSRRTAPASTPFPASRQVNTP